MTSLEQNYCTFVKDVPGWGQTQSTTFAIEFIMCFMAWYNQRPNAALFLIAVCATLKATSVPVFWIASHYTPSYSNATCGFVTVILEFAWFFNDQLPSFSTAHRLKAFIVNDNLKMGVYAFTGCAAFVGAILRICRNSCRGGFCFGMSHIDSTNLINRSALAMQYDMAIAFIACITEIILLSCIFYQCRILKAITKQDLFEFYGKEVSVRVLVCLPLGILEVIGYYMQIKPNPSGAFYWLCMIGINARQLMGSILAMSIICSKEKATKVSKVQASSFKSTPSEGMTSKLQTS
ncbi:hypothetical protein BC833DRAFT_662278 [Globomyces pollinis-pini]|nr:hypothetical protein BC833DRAFT_662278 [Globomyces pollinis-pini]